jgi:hypothetical protein
MRRSAGTSRRDFTPGLLHLARPSEVEQVWPAVVCSNRFVATQGSGAASSSRVTTRAEGGKRVHRVGPLTERNEPITDEGVAVGGAFDSDTATGVKLVAHRVAGVPECWRP